MVVVMNTNMNQIHTESLQVRFARMLQILSLGGSVSDQVFQQLESQQQQQLIHQVVCDVETT